MNSNYTIGRIELGNSRGGYVFGGVPSHREKELIECIRELLSYYERMYGVPTNSSHHPAVRESFARAHALVDKK